jgi:hypothetical protein
MRAKTGRRCQRLQQYRHQFIEIETCSLLGEAVGPSDPKLRCQLNAQKVGKRCAVVEFVNLLSRRVWNKLAYDLSR